MRHNASAIAACARFGLLLLMTGSLGCFAHSRGNIDWDQHPVVNAGVGATILYPGRTAPTYAPSAGGQPVSSAGRAPGTPNQPQPAGPAGPPAAPGSAPNHRGGATLERGSGAAPSAGPPITLIGGASQDAEGHLAWKQDPVWWKYLALPFAVIAAPFKAAARAVGGEPEAGPEIPEPRRPGLEAVGSAVNPAPAPSPDSPPAPRRSAPPDPSGDYESVMLDRLERELAQQQQRDTAASRAAAGGGGALAAPVSIAAELAALQRAPDAGAASTARKRSVPGFTPAAPRHPQPAADGVVDRDGDGRIDQWIYRQKGEITQIDLDETGDGRADRILHYDLDSHQIVAVEVDGNGDGVSDSWTEYEDGQLARRRSDANHDGTVDTWSFYREGVITRREQDSDGDGFRDRIGYYVDGKLSREDHDRDGDGRPDAAIYYDDHERLSRREDDNDSDGRPDVVSYYEAGRLSRREILSPDSAAATARP